jgi:hypothetical protein
MRGTSRAPSTPALERALGVAQPTSLARRSARYRICVEGIGCEAWRARLLRAGEAFALSRCLRCFAGLGSRRRGGAMARAVGVRSRVRTSASALASGGAFHSGVRRGPGQASLHALRQPGFGMRGGRSSEFGFRHEPPSPVHSASQQRRARAAGEVRGASAVLPRRNSITALSDSLRSRRVGALRAFVRSE